MSDTVFALGWPQSCNCLGESLGLAGWTETKTLEGRGDLLRAKPRTWDHCLKAVFTSAPGMVLEDFLSPQTWGGSFIHSLIRYLSWTCSYLPWFYLDSLLWTHNDLTFFWNLTGPAFSFSWPDSSKCDRLYALCTQGNLALTFPFFHSVILS